MHAGWIAVELAEVRQHRVHDLGRGFGGRVVVEINQIHRYIELLRVIGHLSLVKEQTLLSLTSDQ